MKRAAQEIIGRVGKRGKLAKKGGSYIAAGTTGKLRFCLLVMSLRYCSFEEKQIVQNVNIVVF